MKNFKFLMEYYQKDLHCTVEDAFQRSFRVLTAMLYVQLKEELEAADKKAWK